MTSLYVDRRGVELRYDSGAIAFYENSARIGTVPLVPLERVFLRGGVLLHSSLLGQLGERKVGLIVLSGRRGKPSLMLARPHNDAVRRVTQYRLSQDQAFCLRIAQQLIMGKLSESAKYLWELQATSRQASKELASAASQINQFETQVARQTTLAALRGLEGRAAACFFAGLAAHLPPSLKFTGRNRRPPLDPLNVMLSLGYTLLQADIVLALYGAGLDPYIGFFHGLSFGRESLAADLIEPLRPSLDRFAVNLFSSGQLRPENFSNTPQGCLLGKAGRTKFYPLYEEAADGFRKRITQSVNDLINLLRQNHGSTEAKAWSEFAEDQNLMEDALDDWDTEF
jgi:CRISPR-associated protein Cas1